MLNNLLNQGFNNSKTIENMLRVGIVSSVNPQELKARVYFPEFDTESPELAILTSNAFKTKAYNLPDINEMVLCAFLGASFEEGFILGALYNDEDKPLNPDKNIRQLAFDDGTEVSYNRQSRELKIKGATDLKINIEGGNVIINAQNVSLKAPLINLEGNGMIKGNLIIEGNLSAQTITDNKGNLGNIRDIFNSHSHSANGSAPPNNRM